MGEEVKERETERFLDSNQKGLLCDFCYISTRCPKFKIGYSCAWDFAPDVDFSDITSGFQHLLEAQKQRTFRALAFENRDGGAIDKNVSSEIDRMKSLMESYTAIVNPKNTLQFSMSASTTGSNGGGMIKDLLLNALGGGTEKKALPENKQNEEFNAIEILSSAVKEEVKNN